MEIVSPALLVNPPTAFESLVQDANLYVQTVEV